jgi:hypothetical protein
LNAGFIDLSTLVALVFDCGQLAEALRSAGLEPEGDRKDGGGTLPVPLSSTRAGRTPAVGV